MRRDDGPPSIWYVILVGLAGYGFAAFMRAIGHPLDTWFR